jgi:GTPase SAR1 family protein
MVRKAKQETKKEITTTEKGRILHLIDGEKGGVGKSFFCSVLYEWYLHEAKTKIYLIDCDQNNPDVGLKYETATYQRYLDGDNANQIYFAGSLLSTSGIALSEKDSFDYGRADNIIDVLEFQKVDTIVNLPSNVALYLHDWLDHSLRDSYLHGNIVQDLGFSVLRWWVTDGSIESLDLLQATLKHHAYLPIILVLNGISIERFLSQQEQLVINLEKQSGKTLTMIEFPRLSLNPPDLFTIKQSRMSWAQTLLPNSGFNVIKKQRLKTFLRDSYYQISRVLQPLENPLDEVEMEEPEGFLTPPDHVQETESIF